MKVKAKGDISGEKSITIKFKTQEEIDLIREIFFYNCTIPEIFYKTNTREYMETQKLMTKINDKLNTL